MSHSDKIITSVKNLSIEVSGPDSDIINLVIKKTNILH